MARDLHYRDLDDAALVQELAEVTTTRVEPECYVPPTPGSPAPSAGAGS